MFTLETIISMIVIIISIDAALPAARPRIFQRRCLSLLAPSASRCALAEVATEDGQGTVGMPPSAVPWAAESGAAAIAHGATSWGRLALTLGPSSLRPLEAKWLREREREREGERERERERGRERERRETRERERGREREREGERETREREREREKERKRRPFAWFLKDT